MIAPSFSTAELAELANITPRQLQWLDEQGYVCPRQTREVNHYGGFARAYSEPEALIV